MIKYLFFMLSGAITFKGIYDLYLSSFRANQAPYILVILPACAVFVAIGVSILHRLFVRSNNAKMGIALRTAQIIAVLVLPCILLSLIANMTIQRGLIITEKVFGPVITDIERITASSGHPPDDIVTAVNKIDIGSITGYFPHRVVYYRNKTTYAISIDSGSADMDGSINYWDSKNHKWVNIHNDALQSPELSGNAKKFIQSYASQPKILYVYKEGRWKKSS